MHCFAPTPAYQVQEEFMTLFFDKPYELFRIAVIPWAIYMSSAGQAHEFAFWQSVNANRLLLHTPTAHVWESNTGQLLFVYQFAVVPIHTEHREGNEQHLRIGSIVNKDIETNTCASHCEWQTNDLKKMSTDG